MIRHYFVQGRVQGVGFRWFVQSEAADLHLRGWVRNTDAGHVEAVAMGELEQLEKLEQALRKGSRGSRVDRVQVHELRPEEGAALGEFHIDGAI